MSHSKAVTTDESRKVIPGKTPIYEISENHIFKYIIVHFANSLNFYNNLNMLYFALLQIKIAVSIISYFLSKSFPPHLVVLRTLFKNKHSKVFNLKPLSSQEKD